MALRAAGGMNGMRPQGNYIAAVSSSTNTNQMKEAAGALHLMVLLMEGLPLPFQLSGLWLPPSTAHQLHSSSSTTCFRFMLLARSLS